jgi:hypothetical protein
MHPEPADRVVPVDTPQCVGFGLRVQAND